jgi:hypothetical protein
MKATSATAGSHAVIAKYKDHVGQVVETGWAEMDHHAVAAGRPWRTFPWYLGQRNYSGRYWSATEREPVGYESLLELSRLILADYECEVKRIASQPFHLVIRKSGTQHRRTPDYLLVRDRGPLVVDVKSSKELIKDDVVALLELTREVVQSRGWDYEIACEPEKTLFANVRFLAGYRRDWLFPSDVLAEIRSAAAREPQQRICDIVACTGRPKAIALAGLMHLLWRHELRVDLTKTLQPTAVVEVSA